jgi:glycosyltransferase involved in cell wall biosynthesis
MRTRRLSRLLITLPSLRMGGTERHTAEIATRLAAHGLEVVLATEPALHDPLRPHLGPGVALQAAAIGWDEASDPAASGARQMAEAGRLLADLCPDAVFLPLPWPNAGLGIMEALAPAGLPRLLLFHLVAEGDAPPAVAEALPRIGLPGCGYAAVSAPAARRAERLFRLAPGRVAVLDNPAPATARANREGVRAVLRSAIGLRPDAGLVLFVGRLEEAKGADLLPALSDRLKATLVCIGDGPLRGLLDARAAGDPRGLFRVLGAVDNPIPWYLAADALVLPSRLEGAPLVFLEAAAHGLPAVATAAALEALGDTMQDLAWIAGPEPAAIASAVERALADRDASARLAEAAAAHARRLDWEGTVERMLGLLRAASLQVGTEAA